MAMSNRVYPIELQSVDAHDVTLITWTPFTIPPIEDACFFLRITNDTAGEMFISFNGVDRHEFILPYSSIEINFQTNASPSNYVSKLKSFSELYVQGLAKDGDIYLAGYYNDRT